MANREHLAILRLGVERWNQWRRLNWKMLPDMSEANLSGTDLSGINLEGTNLQGANLERASLERADLFQANLLGAGLKAARLEGTSLRQATLIGASLREAILEGANLEGASLEGAVLREASLRETYLSNASLRMADLREASLEGAILEGVILEGAILEGAILERVNLQGADLRWADLSRAVLKEVILRRADFTQTKMDATIFARVDLRGGIGLETIMHSGPSEIAISTLYASGGDIPDAFLRGCGVPDSMIAYARSLVTAERPIDYYSCFISYSSHDEGLAQRLYADLQAKGVRCWYAPHDMQIGDSIIDRIDQAIRLHEKLLLVLSESSVASRWVGTEVKTALMREHHEGRAVLFPIRLDDAVLESRAGWAAQVQGRHIGDFRQWKDHDAYQQAFARLLRDLRAGE